jgi:small-conductance mechanosensitive channel
MDIEERKRYTPLSKITKKTIINNLWIGTTLLFLTFFLIAHFFLKDENLRIFGSLAYKEVLQKIVLGGVFTCIILIFMKWIERLILKETKTLAIRYNLIRVLRLISVLLIAIVIISVLFVNWYAAAVSFGVISLILSFSLQAPLTSLIAWIYILVRSSYRVGDRIKIGTLKGDVVEINYMDTTLWELGGDYLTNDVPSGRLIRFPNSLVLQNAVFNYSWEKFPYIWNEVSVFVVYNSDLEHVEKVMKEITTQELGTQIAESIRNYKEILKYTSVDESDINEYPVVSFNIKEDTWIQAIVTYAVEPKKAAEVHTNLIKRIMAGLKKAEVASK